MNTCWYIHTATLYQLFCRRTPCNIYMLQLYINFSADEHLIIYAYRNFVFIFLQLNTWWYIHTATLYQFSWRWTRDDIYIPQHYINFPAVEHVIIYTYRNFISTFLQMITWWYIHTVTWYQFSSRWTRDDIYIPQLYINFPADEHVMMYTDRNVILTFLQMITWWYIHTATLYLLSCSNFISTFLQINTWWYIHTPTLYQFPFRWTRNDIYIRQLYITFLQMNTCSYIHTTTLY